MKDISDDFVNWLVIGIASAGFERGNLYCFDYSIKNLPSQAPIVEIGSFCGLSTNLITYYKRRHRKYNPLITCDKWEFEGALPHSRIGESSIYHSEYRAFIKETYIRNIRLFSRSALPLTLEKSSDEFFKSWRKWEECTDILGRKVRLGGGISFCFIDGSHQYEQVSRDFRNCHEFLERGGFLLLDDSSDHSPFDGVRRTVKDIYASGSYEIVVQNPNYLFRKVR